LLPSVRVVAGLPVNATRRLPSAISLAIAAVIVLVSVGGYFFLQRSVDQQEKALLQGQTTDAGATASSVFGQLTTSVSSDATLVKLTGGSPSTFQTLNPPSANSPLSINLIRKTGAQYVVVVATGEGLSTGEMLTGPSLATVKMATDGGVTTGPVTSNGKLSYARFAANAGSDLYVYEQFAINPHINVAAALGSPAFSELNVALYGPGPTRPQNLLVTTTRQLPLTGSTSQAKVKVGASNWTLVATAKAPFVSGLASSAPLILLVLGLLIALIVTLTMETVQRRHRYAQALVEERTADLNASLLELKDTQNALVQSERLTAVGEMASVIGHELRNPLAAVTNSLFIVRNDLGDVSPTTEKYLSLAERETSKAATLADDLTAFVRPRELRKTEIQLLDLVHEVLGATPPPDGVEVLVDVGAVDIVGDRGQLAEVFANLVTNAYQAMPMGGELRLSASAGHSGVTIVVEDTGQGVEQTAMEQVFEPFFTTKTTGTGLGLAIVHRLVEAHDGEVTLENLATGGVRVTVILPVVREGVPV
jgi:signal transduction histidine kinase